MFKLLYLRKTGYASTFLNASFKKKIHFIENVLVIWKIQGYKDGYFNKAINIYKTSINIWVYDRSVRKNGTP